MPELGMYYYKARIYSPTLGRFLQTDPIGFNGGMNPYAYAGGNPVNSADPLGLRACVGNEVMLVAEHLRQNAVSDGNGSIILTGPPHDCVSPDQLQQYPNFEGAIYGPPVVGPKNPPPPDCPTASVGDIKRRLPSKGAFAQIRDGVSSYIQGVAWGATALAASAGLGPKAQQQASDTNRQLGKVMDQIASHPGQTLSFVGAVASKYPLQTASRLGSGVIVSVATDPAVGIPVSILAGYGSAFKEAYNHPNVVAAAVVVGQSCRSR
jgi:uncharacterized protein RhaS with RHS repeats